MVKNLLLWTYHRSGQFPQPQATVVRLRRQIRYRYPHITHEDSSDARARFRVHSTGWRLHPGGSLPGCRPPGRNCPSAAPLPGRCSEKADVRARPSAIAASTAAESPEGRSNDWFRVAIYFLIELVQMIGPVSGMGEDDPTVTHGWSDLPTLPPRAGKREAESAGLLRSSAPNTPRRRRPVRRSQYPEQHRSCLLRSRRAAEGVGLLRSSAPNTPRRRRPIRRSQYSEQHRRCLLRSRREAEGVGLLRPSAPTLPRRRQPVRRSQYSEQHRLCLLRSRREAESAGLLRSSTPTLPRRRQPVRRSH